MHPDTPPSKRLSRLRDECDVAAVPVLLLCAAVSVLVLVLVMNAALGETTAVEEAAPPSQVLPTIA